MIVILSYLKTDNYLQITCSQISACKFFVLDKNTSNIITLPNCIHQVRIL